MFLSVISGQLHARWPMFTSATRSRPLPPYVLTPPPLPVGTTHARKFNPVMASTGAAADAAAPQDGSSKFKKIAVFCGASGGGRDGAYIAAAKALGEEMVRRRIGLVYGEVFPAWQGCWP